jgi:hypothetical protein
MKRNGLKFEKEVAKLSLLMDDIIILVENPKEWIKNLQEQVSKATLRDA